MTNLIKKFKPGVGILYSNVGLGDLIKQINFAHSVAKYFGVDMLICDYINTRHSSTEKKINYTALMGLNLYDGYVQNEDSEFSIIDSSDIFSHQYDDKFTKLKYLYKTDLYQRGKLPLQLFDFKSLFELKHGKINVEDNLCIIHLRMGDAMTYNTAYGFFNLLTLKFDDGNSGRYRWNITEVKKIVDHLVKKNYRVEIITDGMTSAKNNILWRKNIPNDFGLSVEDIHDEIVRVGERELSELKNACKNLHIGGELLETIKLILKASQLVVTSDSAFPLQIFNNLCDKNLTKLIDFKKLLHELYI